MNAAMNRENHSDESRVACGCECALAELFFLMREARMASAIRRVQKSAKVGENLGACFSAVLNPSINRQV
ncbi:hypothetical protein [Paraburkholderia tropica]|uniref:hypothetical protein n=1 Tax=Paraburkholderia tropica TaxID=92647 RepID=UPI0011B6FA75|nr:hypothetical protein [Paraburkholderia tropica]MBB3002428.1 hypothetical protein [Paraburkholderia tropica]MBB6321816.1 hypothetical protein [Paraburkholderia tropica]MDE1140319.1 hypothetical protein [Paraburkholderia tropica]